MPTIVTNTLFAIAGAALTLMSVPASADTLDTQTRQIDVRYGDLDLDSAAGRTTLHRRISAAAYNVCKTDDDSIGQAASALCREEAVAGATRQIHAIAAATTTQNRVALR